MDGSFIFLSAFNWCHSLHFLKYKWALWLEILRVRGSYINGGDIRWLPNQFLSWRGMMDNGLIPLVTQPAPLQPVYFCRMIHQPFPAASVTTNLRRRSVPFMTNVSWFWQEYKTVFYGDLLQLHDIMTTKVWTCLFCFLDIKPSRRGRQKKK